MMNQVVKLNEELAGWAGFFIGGFMPCITFL